MVNGLWRALARAWFKIRLRWHVAQLHRFGRLAARELEKRDAARAAAARLQGE